jgi:hypothetical protein
MGQLPLLEEHPLPLRIFLAGVVPAAFGALTGYFLWSSEAAYLVCSLIAVVGGIGAGFDHVGVGAGARRGLLGGTLFSVALLLAHEIHGAEPLAEVPEPEILIVPVFALLGVLFGALGGWLRERSLARSA